VIISTLLDNLGRHPIRCTDEGVFLGRKRAGKLSRNTKVSEFDFASSGQEDIGGCVDKIISTRIVPDKADAPLISR
jgi:hypothetical protein